jgi:dihydroflavonol-4-reductase
MKTVGIVGGSGFIGSYVTRKFLREGYKVRVSATDISKSEKYEHLRGLENAANLEIVPVNVMEKAGLQSFINGCDIVVHGGTPFQLAVEDAQRDMLDPTIKGTEQFLEVAGQAPGLKKVVFIASVAAYNTNFPMPVPGRAPDHVISETDAPFHSVDSIPYAQAKYFADQAVRRYVETHPNPAFEIVSLCPVLVAGPALSARQDSTSQGFQFLAKNKMSPDGFFAMLWETDMEWAVVDVLDVADAVFNAATKPGLHGKCYLLSADSWKMSDINRLLNNQPPAGTPRMAYSSTAATRDLGVTFKSGSVPFGRFGQS